MFHALIKNNALHFTPFNQLRFNDFLSKNEGKEVRIEPVKSKRSDRQNRYYWLCLEIISNTTGYHPDELHALFKGLYLKPKHMKWKAIDYKIAGSTSDLSKTEFMDYMNRIVEEVAQLGITLPDPSQFELAPTK